MKRFLDKRIVIAQDDKKTIVDETIDAAKAGFSLLPPIVDPNSDEGKKSTQIDNLEDSQKGLVTQRAREIVMTNVDNKNEAISIFKNNGKDEYFYEDILEKFYSGLSVPYLQFNQYIIGLWPGMRIKNFSFDKFLQILTIVAQRYKSPEQIDSFFKNFIGVLPNLEKTLGTSDEVIDKAIDFLTNDKGAEELQEYLLYQMLLRYGLYDEIPDNKKSEIFKATETLQKVRQNVGPLEAQVQEYLIKRAEFLQAQNKWFEDNSLVFLSIDYYNMDDVKSRFEKGVDDVSIKFYMENFRKGAAFDLYLMSNPMNPNATPSTTTGVPVGGNKKGSNTFFRRTVLAQGTPQNSANRAGYPKLPPGETTNRETETTDSKSVSEEYGELFILIQQFESTLSRISKSIDEEIKFIIDKQAGSSEVGPFKAGLTFQYLQNEDESIYESDRIIALGDRMILNAKETLNKTKEKFDRFVESKKANITQKNNAETLIKEKYDLFEKNIRSKQLSLKFNKVLLSNYNEFSETEDLYNSLKIDMENNVSARPIISPKAILAGFKMADILENIADRFKSISVTNPLRSEQAIRTARKWENFAKQMRASVFAEIYPGMAQSLGLEATRPGAFPSFDLRAASVKILDNQRFAGKFMDKEVESDKKFRDYWNNLFMQSLDPRPMGDIIEEKPKHGNLTTEEDAKLHKKTMRKFKKPAAKSRFKKN